MIQHGKIHISIYNKTIIINLLDPVTNENYVDYEGFIYIIDISNKDTLKNFHKFVQKVQKLKSKKSFPLVIFFNKMDKELDQHEIKEKDIKEFMKYIHKNISKDIKFFLGSSKTGHRSNK